MTGPYLALTPRSVASIADLRNLSPGITTAIALTGYYAPGDGGGGEFYGVTGAAPGTYVENNGTIILPTGGDGSSAWLRVYEGAVNIRWFGAKGDGITDDRTAFADADATVGANGQINVTTGTYVIGTSAITLTAVLVFEANAILKPSTYISVNLRNCPVAGIYQIFDRSGGGAIQFLNDGYGRGTFEVYADWWGAKAGYYSGVSNNQVYIQYALDALQSVFTTSSDYTTPAPNANNNGGIVRLTGDDYYMTGPIIMRQRVQIIGISGFSSLSAHPTLWNPAEDSMVQCVNGTSSQFYVRLQDLTIQAQSVDAVVYCIYALAWQQCCGLTRVTIRKFKHYGIYMAQGYGGAYGAYLNDLDMAPDLGSTSPIQPIPPTSVYCDMSTFGVGYFNLVINNLATGSGSTSVPGDGSIGLSLKGNVSVQASGLYFEGSDVGVYMQTSSILNGYVSATGNNSVGILINPASNFTGNIDLVKVIPAGSTTVLRSFVAGANNIFYDYAPIYGRLRYPYDPSAAFAYTRNTSSSGSILTTSGFSSITRNSAGNYTLTFDGSKISTTHMSGTSYLLVINIGSTQGRTCYVASQSAGSFQLQFKDLTNTAADCDFFDVYAYPTPGY